MFYAYGMSIQGADHIKEDTAGQDSHKIIKCSENMLIAAVADGLGSERYSDVASKIAADTASTCCAETLTEDSTDEEIYKAIKQAFFKAKNQIEDEAKSKGHDVDQYDTTLTLAVIIRDSLYYGHCGDSGIIALNRTGIYSKVTDQQRDDYGRVFPICFEDHWRIDKYPEPVGSVLLATDGMLDTFFPVWIRNEPVNINVLQAMFFMDPEKLMIDKKNEAETAEKMERILKAIDPNTVGDDKTIVVAVNKDIICDKQPEEYYAEPNWTELKKRFDEEWKKAAYPGLYSSDGAD